MPFTRPAYARTAPLMSRAAIGSGGSYALAAARALIDIPGMDALTIGVPLFCTFA